MEMLHPDPGLILAVVVIVPPRASGLTPRACTQRTASLTEVAALSQSAGRLKSNRYRKRDTHSKEAQSIFHQGEHTRSSAPPSPV